MPETPRRFNWRLLVRSLHRDAGYLAIGLTLIYAVSGLAVNHIRDWDPNFRHVRRVHELGPLPGDDAAVTQAVLTRLRIGGKPREVYRASPEQLDILFDNRALHVNPGTGRVLEKGQQPRLFLRLANWLHLNRGKPAWTVIADLYALGLLFLAISGLFMLPARKGGLLGRGGVLVLVGIAVPVLYVVLSGGP